MLTWFQSYLMNYSSIIAWKWKKINFFLTFSFLGALKSVPFFVAMLFWNSPASSFLQMFTSNEAWNLCSSKISDSSKILNSWTLYRKQALQHISAFSLHSLAALHVLASLWNEDYLYNFSFSFYFDVNTISLSVVFSFTVRPFLAPIGAQTAIVSNNWSATW